MMHGRHGNMYFRGVLHRAKARGEKGVRILWEMGEVTTCI